MLASVARTACHPERIEVVLVVDADDRASLICHPQLTIRHVVVPPGLSMGALNNAGYQASTGRYVMLLNDDVIVRTPGWDAAALECFGRFPDPFVLVHVNDTLMCDHLCTFPLTSRAFYELTNGICPREYQRYRIDDHIEDIFNLLGVLGERRVVYLPDVVFEHDNASHVPEAGRPVYLSDPSVLAEDAPLFDALFPDRKADALRVFAAIDGRAEPHPDRAWRARLDAAPDSFALRLPGRQFVIRTPRWRGPLDALKRIASMGNRARRKNAADLLRAVRKRLQGARANLKPQVVPDSAV
jgi:hypothetical protein